MLIIICILLCSASCYGISEEAQIPASHVELIVEEPKCTYSDDFCNEIAASVTDIIARILFEQKELMLTENDRTKLAQNIIDELLPITEAVPVYPDELLDLCNEAEELMLSDKQSIELFGSLYSLTYSIIGDTRTEVLCYDFLKLYLEYSLEKAEDYYEQTGYPWYAEDIEIAKRQISLLNNAIGKEKFSIMLAPFVIASNTLFGNYNIFESGDNALSNKDISLLIGEYLTILNEHK